MTEIADIVKNVPDLEVETFVHGAMCMSISGRCVISNYLAHQDANQGACVHPCRWKYHLMEETRPGEYFPVFEDEQGTYLFNSKDLCMIEHIPALVQAGITSFKIEGRMKTPLYVAMVTKVYRQAIDDYFEDPARYAANHAHYLDLLSQVSHRGYGTGFYFGAPDESAQSYETNEYEKQATFVAKVIEIREDGKLVVQERNKFSVGDTLRILLPKEIVEYHAEEIVNGNGERVESASHAEEIVTIPAPNHPVPVGAIMLKGDAR